MRAYGSKRLRLIELGTAFDISQVQRMMSGNSDSRMNRTFPMFDMNLISAVLEDLVETL
jgi:hypothetical protein